MGKIKQTQEELMQTHVLNLDEIREAEKKEIYMKSKRFPMIFAFLGFIFILAGIVYPGLNHYFVKNEAIEVASMVEKNALTCIANIDDKTNNLKVYTKTIYNFHNSKLSSSESNTTISVLSGNDYTNLNLLKEHYNDLYTNIDQTIAYKIYLEHNSLYFNSVISNYSNFNQANYNSEINRLNHTSIFAGGESVDQVKKSEERLGSLCH